MAQIGLQKTIITLNAHSQKSSIMLKGLSSTWFYTLF